MLEETFDIPVVGGDGQAYRLWVAVPEGPAPASGFPLLVAVDAARCFGTLRDTAATLAVRREVTGASAGVVCGIAYSAARGIDEARRCFDLTPAMAEDAMPPHPSGGNWPPTGGAGAFAAFIAADALPRIAALLPIDPGRMTLFGHSLGGLYVLLEFLAGQTPFSRFVAVSPSIWFAPDLLAAGLDRLAAGPKHGRRLLVVVGGREEPAPGGAGDRRADRQRANRIVGRARDLVARAAEAAGNDGSAELEVLDGENHGSVLPGAIARTIPFAFADKSRDSARGAPQEAHEQ